MKTDIKTQILDVSERLFILKGISETGVADIAKAIGISKGTLYYHFSSKDEIITSVAERHLHRSTCALKSFVADLDMNDSTELIINNFIKVVKYKKTTERLHYTLMAYGVIKCDLLKEKIRNEYLDWVNLVEGVLIKKHPDRPQVTNRTIAEFLLAIFDGLAIKNMMGLPTINSESLSEINEILKKLF